MKHSVYIGWDPREAAAFAVARHSARRSLALKLPVRGIVLEHMRKLGLYRREMQRRPGPYGKPILWDPISDAPCSTEFSISRFLVPFLAKEGWAVFMDCDVLVMGNLNRIFDGLDRSKALYCVKRADTEQSGQKMDGQVQTTYSRKNWSSVCIWNCDHPSNKKFTVEKVNKLPGRDLHAFKWLKDSEIGELDSSWNHLVGVDPEPSERPNIAHFTLGTPDMEGHQDCPYAEQWWAALEFWAGSA